MVYSVKYFALQVTVVFEKNLQLSYLIDFYAELLSDRQQRVLDLYYNQDLSLGDFLREVRSRDIEIKDTQRDREGESENGARAYVSTLKLQKRQNHVEVIEEVRAIPGVLYIEEL